VDVPIVRTERLELISFSPAVMRAVVAGDHAGAERLLGAAIVGGLDEELRGFFELRLADLVADPSMQPWLGRAIVLVTEPENRRAIGSVGFHGPPDPDGRAEIGYQVEPGSRRRGLALEAVRGLLDWAATEHGIQRFRASITPENVASLALVRRLGFREVGRRDDDIDGDIDGEELVFELDEWETTRPF
jgi:[ribosomal protein S5]-alanine N-acetyltransferase